VDPVRAKAEKNHPPDSAEFEAETLVERETQKFNDWLRAAGRRTRDAGIDTGDFAGFGFLTDNLKQEYEELRDSLEKALVKRNTMIRTRKAAIQREVEEAEAKLALEAQREYQRKVAARNAPEPDWQPFRPVR